MSVALRARKACEDALASVSKGEWVYLSDVLKAYPEISLRAMVTAIERIEAEGDACVRRSDPIWKRREVISFRKWTERDEEIMAVHS